MAAYRVGIGLVEYRFISGLHRPQFGVGIGLVLALNGLRMQLGLGWEGKITSLVFVEKGPMEP